MGMQRVLLLAGLSALAQDFLRPLSVGLLSSLVAARLVSKICLLMGHGLNKVEYGHYGSGFLAPLISRRRPLSLMLPLSITMCTWTSLLLHVSVRTRLRFLDLGLN